MGADISNRQRIWQYRGGQFELGRRTLLMGVVNITPDSFSDGGKYFSREAAVTHAEQLIADGADILDLGAESTRPGSLPVAESEQLDRLLPVIRDLAGRIPIPISVDTTSSVVARKCLSAGASIVNDISGFHQDPDLPSVCAEFEAGMVLMHIRGIPRTMQDQPQYGDLLGEVHEYLEVGTRAAARAGIPGDRVAVDPGIGFGKTFEHNYQLLGALHRFRDLGAGVLVGPSRKKFTGQFSKLPPDQRQFPTAAAVAIAVLNGADAVRVHDVREMRQVVDILDRYRSVQESVAYGTADR